MSKLKFKFLVFLTLVICSESSEHNVNTNIPQHSSPINGLGSTIPTDTLAGSEILEADGNTDTDDVDVDEVDSETLKSHFDLMNEKDVGQETSNLFILARRYLESKTGPADLDTINKFLKPFGLSLTEEQFRSLLAIVPVTFSLPLSSKAKSQIKSMIGTIGNPLRGDKLAAICYTFNRISTVASRSLQQYVGSSIVGPKRLAKYLAATTPKVGDRAVMKAIHEYGLRAFTLSLYVVDPSLYTTGDNGIDRLNAYSLARGLEQYLIFQLRPSLNVSLLSAGLVLKPVDDSKLAKLYVYKQATRQLVFITTSRAMTDTGLISPSTLVRAILLGAPSLGFFFSRSQWKAPVNLMTWEQLVDELMENQLERLLKQIKDPQEAKIRTKAVRLTDISTPDKPVFEFASRKEACAFSKAYGKSHIYPNVFIRSKTKSFEYKDWFVELS